MQIQKLFVQSEARAYVAYGRFITTLTLLSIIFIVLESVGALATFSTFFFVSEWIIVAVFTFDYIGNLVTSQRKGKYVFSFLGVADLISILPTYLGLGNLTFLKSIRVVRIFRLLRLARLAKVTKISKATEAEKDDVHFLYKVNLEIYFAALFSVILAFGSIYHILEPELYPSIPAGMLLAAKLVVAGLSHVTPNSLTGEILTILNRFAALVLFGLLISVVGNAVRKFLFGSTTLIGEEKDVFK